MELLPVLVTAVILTTPTVSLLFDNLGQTRAPEYGHFDISFVCRLLGFDERRTGDSKEVFYRGANQKSCGPGTVFNIKVCTCVHDTTVDLLLGKRPVCENILTIQSGSSLLTSSNGHKISYSGDYLSIFSDSTRQLICYRGAYFGLDYMASNDFGSQMNLRFTVKVDSYPTSSPPGRAPEDDANSVLILTNGDCQDAGSPGSPGPARILPSFGIWYNPYNDSYSFLTGRQFNSLQMNPIRNAAATRNADDINMRFNRGEVIVSINDQQINRSGGSLPRNLNIFSAFNYKLSGTVCPLRIGNPVGPTALNANVCIGDLSLKRDCAADT